MRFSEWYKQDSAHGDDNASEPTLQDRLWCVCKGNAFGENMSHKPTVSFALSRLGSLIRFALCIAATATMCSVSTAGSSVHVTSVRFVVARCFLRNKQRRHDKTDRRKLDILHLDVTNKFGNGPLHSTIQYLDQGLLGCVVIGGFYTDL